MYRCNLWIRIYFIYDIAKIAQMFILINLESGKYVKTYDWETFILSRTFCIFSCIKAFILAYTFEQKVHFICPLFLQHIILFGRLSFEDNHQTCFCHITFILFICFILFFSLLINRTIMSGLMIWHKMM